MQIWIIIQPMIQLPSTWIYGFFNVIFRFPDDEEKKIRNEMGNLKAHPCPCFCVDYLVPLSNNPAQHKRKARR